MICMIYIVICPRCEKVASCICLPVAKLLVFGCIIRVSLSIKNVAACFMLLVVEAEVVQRCSDVLVGRNDARFPARISAAYVSLRLKSSKRCEALISPPTAS